MKNLKLEIKWAVIFTAFMLLWLTMEMLFGFHGERIEQHAIVTNFVAIPAILVYVLAMKDKKKNFYSGQMTYLQGLRFAILLSLFVAILSPLCMYISLTLISPDYFANAINYGVENKLTTLEAAEAYFNLKNYMVEGSIGSFVMGIVTGAIVAIFLRTKNA